MVYIVCDLEMKPKNKIKPGKGDGQPTYLPWCIDPGKMAEVGVHWNRYNFTVYIMKFVGFVTESNNFCRAHKSAWEKKKLSLDHVKTETEDINSNLSKS